MNPSGVPHWFVRRNNQVFGPFTADQMARGKAENQLAESDLIAETRQGPWMTVSAFFSAASGSPPVPAAAAPPAVKPPPAPVLATPVLAAPALGPAPAAPRRNRALVVIGALGATAVAFVALLLLCLVFAWLGGESSNEVQSVVTLPPASETSSEFAVVPLDSANPGPEEEPAYSLEEAPQTLQELQEAPTILAPQESIAEESLAAAPALAPESEELSDELLALSPEEATELAASYLSPEQREAHGRTAFLLLQRAADAGNGRAMYFLFGCYGNGIGTPEDPATALAWLARSAESGDAAGMFAYSLGISDGQYEGLGESEALMWLNRSAEVGHPAAIQELQRRQTEEVFGAVGDLFSRLGAGSEGDEERSEVVCSGGVGFFDHCRCDGFVQGGGPSDSPDPFVCKNCGHQADEHSR